MRKIKFLRSDTVRHVRIGSKQRKLQKWRKPRGRHSKIRRKHFSYPRQPGIGYKRPAAVSGLVKGTRPVYVASLHELQHVPSGGAIIISRRIGAKKKIDFLRIIQEKKLVLINGGSSRETR